MSRKKTLISELDLTKIGGRIAYLRVKNDLTQAQLSENTGLSKGNVSGLESHKYEPSARAIIKIVELFGVTTDWLLFGDRPNEKTDFATKATAEFNKLLLKFKNQKKIKSIIEDLIILEEVDIQGFEEIRRIIEMKLEVKKPSRKKENNERKKIS